MPAIPAFCDTCGSIFPSGFYGENSQTTFVNCSSGPCPICGGTGHIPDGVYVTIGNTIKLLSGPKSTIDNLQKLANILKNYKSKDANTEEIKKRVQEEIPELTSITDLLPKTRQDVYQVILIILAIIAIIVPIALSGNQVTISPDEVIEHIYNQSLPQIPSDGNFNAPVPSHIQNIKNLPIRVSKIGRNELCLCGSGLKYKKCCGKLC